MSINKMNLLQPIPENLSQEYFEELLKTNHFTLERIVSLGHITQPDTWYDQARNEWVLLLSGAARLEIENQKKHIEMQPGDCLLLKAALRHRVVWTDPVNASVWLALHFD